MRGGYGVFFTSPISRGSSNGSSIQTQFVSTFNVTGRTSANSVGNPFPQRVLKPTGSSLGIETFLGQRPSFADVTTKVPYVHQL